MPTMLLAAATEEAHRELPMPAEVFGLIALAVFATLFAFTWAFRSIATKH
jgi:drug/metabolite transporter (DMT)-like permease